MLSGDINPVLKRSVADGVLQRAASGLDRLLEELTSALDLFPYFIRPSSNQALEVDPTGVADPEPGCVRFSANPRGTSPIGQSHIRHPSLEYQT